MPSRPRKVIAAVATAALVTAGLLLALSPASATPQDYVASYVPGVDGPIALSPSGSLLAATSGSTVRLVWTSSETDATAAVALSSVPTSLQFSADGSRLVVAETTGLQVFGVATSGSNPVVASLTPLTGTPASQLSAPTLTSGHAVDGLVVTSSTTAIALQEDAAGNGLLVVYSFPPSGTPAAPFVAGSSADYGAVALSRDAATIYAATSSTIAAINVATLMSSHNAVVASTITMNAANTPEALAISPDGTTLAVGGSTALVSISTATKTIASTLTYPESEQGYPGVNLYAGTVDWNPMPPIGPTACDSLAFSGDSKMVYCAGPDLYWFAAPTLAYRGALRLNSAAGTHLNDIAVLGNTATPANSRVYVGLGPSTQVESVPPALLTQASLPVGSTPGPPTAVTASAGADQITVSWVAPANTGGLPLTGYTVTADPYSGTTDPDGGTGPVTTLAGDTSPLDDATCSPGGTGTSCTLTSLTPWLPYTIFVVAINAQGKGSPATASSSVIPGIPGPPAGLSATIGSDEALHVTWAPSTYNGAAPITGYQVWAKDTAGTVKVNCAYPSGLQSTLPDATSCTIGPSGLTKGKTYEIDAVAVNHATNGASVQVSAATTITYGAPSAPVGAAVVPGDTSMVITWSPPAYIGGTIKNYMITVMPGSIHCGTTLGVDARACTITGLTNGTHYSVSVVAVNSTGTGAPALFPDVVPATVPSGPVITDLTAHSGELDVTWAAPVTDGGQPITKYTAVAKVNQSSTPKSCTTPGTTFGCAITGLTNGTTYTVTVIATNAMGDGSPSLSQSATPNGPPAAPAGVQATVKGGAVTVTWAPTTNTTITGYSAQTNTGEGCEAPGGSTRCVIQGVGAGQHNVTVWAESGSETSDGSDPVSFVVLPKLAAPKVTSKVLNRKHHRVTITFRWKAPKGFAVSGYRVERRNGDKRFVGSLQTTFTFKTGGYRNVRVVAINNDGESTPSNWRRVLAR